MSVDLMRATTCYEVVVLEGCDGTGKTTFATALATGHGYTMMHCERTPDGLNLAARYRSMLAVPGKLVLDRSFISELVYGPLLHGGVRLSSADTSELVSRVGERGGVLVHLTGHPDEIAARLRARDGHAPAPEQIRVLLGAYQSVFAALAVTVPVITANITTVARR
jgi:thymidylate kinase